MSTRACPASSVDNNGIMKAITYSRYGPPDVMELADVVKPVPKDDEILVRVHAAEATKTDCEMRSFKYSVKWFWLPLRIALGVRRPKRKILGGYFAGEIESIGKNVRHSAPGDQVFACAQFRLGEYVALPASYAIAPKPGNRSFAKAAAVPLGGLNALHFMRLAKIQSGVQVAINDTGGSIGSIVDAVYPMQQAAAAHHRVDTEQRVGAVVIAIADDGNAA